jgi:hypothetical protein
VTVRRVPLRFSDIRAQVYVHVDIEPEVGRASPGRVCCRRKMLHANVEPFVSAAASKHSPHLPSSVEKRTRS